MFIHASLVLLNVLIPALTFQCSQDGYYPDPEDCSKYFHCAGGQPYSQSCPGGLVFNGASSQCDWPANVNCNAKPEPGPSPTLAPEPEPEPHPDSDAQSAPAGKFKIVCYFPNWAGYRTGEGKYTPQQIDPNLCTHVVYAFAVLDETKGTIKAFDSWADIDQGFYKQTVALKKKNPKLKVMIAIGGWTDSSGSKYSKMVANAAPRKKFIEDVVKFMKQHGFDGLDLDWEYPGCPQGNCGASQDKKNFGLFVKELRQYFDKQNPRYELSAAVSASKNVIDAAYDMPAMASAMDHINVMAYDYHGAWETKTGQNAPFKAGAGMDSVLTVEYSMKYWAKGIPKGKLVMGLPAYGKSFTLTNAANNGFGAGAKGAGKSGQFTGEGGLLAYYEICKSIKSDGWKKGNDANAGPYAYKGDQWVGYDDPAAIDKKTKFARDGGYGGAMVWDIAMDDFTGNCCGVKNPLLNVINNVLYGKGKSASSMQCK